MIKCKSTLELHCDDLPCSYIAGQMYDSYTTDNDSVMIKCSNPLVSEGYGEFSQDIINKYFEQ
jgi:hypothetical protein